MKKTFLTLMLLFIANLSIAQDASNDATWEETIEFINKQEEFIILVYDHHGRLELDCEVDLFQIDGEKLFYKYPQVSSDTYDFLKVIGSAELKKIESVDDKYDYIKIWFTGYYNIFYVENTDDDNGQVKKEKSYLKFKVSDSEMHKRLLKAFQHLAYLATEKRKEEIKKSGSKF